MTTMHEHEEQWTSNRGIDPSKYSHIYHTCNLSVLLNRTLWKILVCSANLRETTACPIDVGRRCCSKFKCSLNRNANDSSNATTYTYIVNAMKRCGILTKEFSRWAHNIQWTVELLNLSRSSLDDAGAHCTCVRLSRVLNGIVHSASALLSTHKHISTLNYLERVSICRHFCVCHMCTVFAITDSRARAFLWPNIF